MALQASVLIFSLLTAIDAATITSIYPARGSTEGGTYLVISGSGFMMPVEANPWDSQVVYVGAKICNIHAHYTSSTRIVCETTPHDIPAENSESLTVSVQAFGGLGLAGYTSRSSAFQYHYYDTPLFYWSDGWAGTGGDVVAFQGDVFPGASVAGQFDIRIGGARCLVDQETYPLSSRRRGSLKQVQCTLPDDDLLSAGHYNVTIRVGSLDREDGSCPNTLCFPYTQEQAGTGYGYGMAAIVPLVSSDSVGKMKRVWGGSIDLATGQPYHYTIYPQVNSIAPLAGSLFGGNNLTLTGSSFAADLVSINVTVGDAPCEVLEASSTQIVCRLSQKSGRGNSMRGLMNAVYGVDSNSRRRRVWAITGVPPPQDRYLHSSSFYKGSLDSINSDSPYDADTLSDHRMRELTGFFVPPLTASYSFYICGDDQESIEIASSKGSPTETLETIAMSTDWETSGDYGLISPQCWYYREDLKSLPELSGPTKKISDPVFLQSGMRYPFRLRHIAHGGANWLRTAIKVSGLTSATLADGSTLNTTQVQGMTALMPSMEVQAIRLLADGVLREKHWIEIADVNEAGSFRIRISGPQGSESTMSFPNSVDANDVRDGVKDAQVIIAGEEPYRLHNCNSVSVSTNETGAARRFTLTFNCPLQAGTTSWVGISIVVAGPGMATAGKAQNATAPLAGSFVVGHSGTWSSPIQAREATTSWSYLTSQVSSMRRAEGHENGQLELECWTHPDGFHGGESFQVLVRFRRPLGNVPLLQINATGLQGTGFSLEVYPVEDGDSDAMFIERVTADMFEVPYPSDPNIQPVRVVINGIVGGIGGSSPIGYKYTSELVPVLVSVSPTVIASNGTLTFVVDNVTSAGEANWTKDILLVFGDNAGTCEDTQEVSQGSDGITLTCMLQDVPAGTYPVNLISITQGQADPSQAPNISVEPVLDDVSGLTGSLAGGTVLELTGVGLRGVPCSGVLVDGVPCTAPSESKIQVTSSATLVCLTPAMSGFDPSSSQDGWPATSNAEITLQEPSIRSSSVRATFTYASASTPLLSSVDPTFYSSALSTFINVTGSGFTNGGSETALPIVQFGARMGSVTSQDDTVLAVFLIRAAPTPPDEPIVMPLVWIPGKGFTAVPSGVTFESRFEVTDISPTEASKAGGVVINITGAGFHPTDASKHLINFATASGLTRPCEVLSGTPTLLTCRLKGGATSQNIETNKLYADDTFMRRLSMEDNQIDRRQSKLRCSAGADDHSKVRCFALAAGQAGSVRSFPSSTAAGHTADMLDWIRRSELEGDQGKMLDPVYNIDTVSPDAFVFGPETEEGEPARRLEETAQFALDSRGLQGLPRWGVASDEAEDFRLVHMRTRHFHGKDAFSTKKKEEASSEESESSESDSDTTDLVRLLSSAGDDSDSDNSTNTTDDSDTAPKIEELTLDLTLNGVIPTCKISGGCGLNLTDDKTPFVEHVTPLNGSFDDGTTVVITVAMSSEPQDVQVFFGPFECPGAVVTSPKSGRWTVTVPLCAFEASITPVYVLTSTGYAVAGSPFTGASFQFEQFLKLKSITPSSGSFYGGSLVTIEGAGLGPTAAMNYATVGGYPCEVISASNTQIQCYTPAAAAELATENSTVRTQDVKVQVLSAQVSSSVGLMAEYFFFAQGSSLPNLDSRVPDLKRIEGTINQPDTGSKWFDQMLDSDNFAVRWTGFVSVKTTGEYTFYLGSDDGSKMYLNGAMIINNDGTHGMRTRSSLPMKLQGNSQNRVTILFFERTGGAGIRLQYTGPDTGGQLIVVPSSVLSHGVYGELPTLPFTYNDPASSPMIENLTETGSELVLQVNGTFNNAVNVSFGTATNPNTNFECNVISWSSSEITCTRPTLPSGAWQVRVYVDGDGWSNPAPSMVWVPLTLTSVESNGVTVDATSTSEPWILVMKLSHGGILGYDSEYWTNTELLNPTSPEDMPDNAKYQAYLDAPFKRLRACVGSSNGKCVHHKFDSEWSSAKALFSAGYIRDPTVDQAGLIQALGATPGSYRACPMLFPGFNLECPNNNKARWGFCANCPSQSCQSESSDADAAVGIGLRGESSSAVGAGWTDYFAPGGGTCTPTSETHRDVWLWVENTSAVNGGVNGQLFSGYGGGVTLNIQGTGLGFAASQTKISVCGEPCEVSASNDTAASCAVPSMTDQDFIDAFPDAFPSIDLATVAAKFYTDRGEQEEQLSKLAFTSPIDQQIDMSMGVGPRSGCWFGFELPHSKEAFLTAVDFFPPTDPNRRNKVVETVFEIRSFSGNLTWEEVASVRDSVWTGESIAQGWTSYPISGSGVNGTAVGQAFRIRLLPDACQTSGELMRGVRFRGILLNKGNTSACPIEVESISHPLASAIGGSALLPATLSYSLARTPQVTSLTPNRGTARGDTLVTLLGDGLEPLDSSGTATGVTTSNAVVTFNGYDCIPQEANATALSCMTTERNAGINAPSTTVFLEGRGYAIISERAEDTVFRYVDKWSNIYSWLESEPPVDGDSVVVPEGQAIMLDVNSPKLFLLLISGYFEFDRRDLMLNSTYIWIAGGSFYVGSEAAPFLNQATITLHGDRWFTIELPVIGSKMLAVTDLGGLGTCAHLYKRTNRLSRTGNHYVDPCPVKLVGRMELHGKPGISWTRLVETAPSGSSLLKLEEAVDWEVGVEVVITPTERGHQEEVRRVQSIEDNGFTIRLDEPLSREHLGIWYYNAEIPTPTDLRAGVGRLNRNVKVQGDERSAGFGNAYMFGVHIGAFHGGVMRIENTEITRSGQAANFGRYSSHWHVLSPHRTVDVADIAYLRNNSYHDTFQRAVVVHSTDFAVVRDNVALKTKGHSFFTEAGDEVFTLYEHNLAVHPLQHPLLLDDDMTPAGFWQGGFQGWHRSNMAANCHRGWRVRLISGPAGSQTDMTFFNNTAHASGFGWHLKPPHAPPTLNNFLSFTAFRCGTGMFYYGTGNIFHDDHRFIECGTGHFMNHLSNGLHTAPFYHNLVLVGNIDPASTTSRMNRGIRSAKDNEYFYVSGVTAINLRDKGAFEGCFETVCTMRYERCRWFNSTKHTFSNGGKMAGIFWDMDGTLTGYPNGFVSKFYEFNTFPGICQTSSEHENGVVCGASDGSVRVRRLKVDQQEPWQLDGKTMRVITSAGYDEVEYDFLKIRGWGVPVVENQTYDMRVNDPNDFQNLRFQYSERNYVMEEHGYYNKTTPKSEDILLHLNYTDWRDHFDGTTGERLSRMPTSDDPFGSYSMILRQDQCDLFNLTDSSEEKCGVYVNDTGLELKAEIDEQPEFPTVNGRLTTSFAMKVIGDQAPYTAGPGTPSGAFRQTFIPRECPKSGCPQPEIGKDGYLPQRRWSDASSWPNQRLPREMENVVLPPTDNVLLDVVTPKLNWVDIQGKLEFDRALNTTLNAASLKVWGKLEMGTVDNPMPRDKKAEIVLWGAEQATTVIMVEGLFLVNKVVAVLGEISAVGTPRTSKAWTRLSQTAEVGAQEMVLQGDVSDWLPGSQVAISATEYPSPPQTTETEVLTISGVSYQANDNTTTVTLSSALAHRHFAGVVDSSAENVHWPRPFLAAAVALLDGRSNVVIRTGEEFSEHGGDVVIGGSSDGRWEGIATISNVDFIRMGKFWYQAPALKFNFLGGQKNMSRVENCVFSRSQSGAIEANYASNLELVDNVFHRTTRTAVWIRKTSSHDAIVLRRNIAIETLRHPSENTDWVRHFGAFYLEVRPAVLYGNVAAGSCDTGFILRPQLAACQKGDMGKARLQQDELNEAVATLTGVFILDGCESQCDECAQVHGLVAWKSAHGGIMSGDQNANLRLDTILLADNHIGVALRFLRSGDDLNHRTYSYNVSVYGSTAASTCDASINCRALGETDVVGLSCNSVIKDKYRRVGIMTHMNNNMEKFCEAKGIIPCRPPTTPIKPCVMPWEERMGSQGSRYSESHWDGITFGHFAADDCGRPSVAFTYNPTNIDVAYPQFFSGVVWLPSVEANAKVFLGESTITHNSVVATGEFDGVNQMVLTDVDGSLLGTESRDASLVTVYNPALAIQSCTERGSSYYECPELSLRALSWQAVGDPGNRVFSKFKAWRASDSRETWSLGPQEEKACRPVGAAPIRNWKVRPNDNYNLTMFTSPPKNHKLFFFNDNPDETIRLDIFLTQPFRLEVFVDGVLISEDLYDTAKKTPSRLPELTDPHGSYAFDPQARRFYLVMQGGFFGGKAATLGGGRIDLKLLQVVQITMTVSVALADFDDVEQNKFINNVATLLQIPSSRIKIVSVQSKAQVAAQGGRLLQDVPTFRNLQDEGVEVIFQVIEDETVSTGDDFSGAAVAELRELVTTLASASEAGSLSTLLGFAVVLESWDITDVPTSDGEDDANATVTTTTVSTTFTYSISTTSSTTDPNSTTEEIIEELEDPTAALVQSILIGAAVGIAVGFLMMVVGYLVRRRFYSNNVHTTTYAEEGQQEALNP